MSTVEREFAQRAVAAAEKYHPGNLEAQNEALTMHADLAGCSVMELRAAAGLDPNRLRAAHLSQANHWMHLSPGLREVRRILTQPPSWVFVGAYGEVPLTAQQFAEFRTAKVKINDATGEVPSLEGADGSKVKWDRVYAALNAARVDVEVGNATDAGMVLEWLGDYVQACPPEGERDPITRWPYQEGDDVLIFATHFGRWLMQSRGERVGRDLPRLLRAAGLEVQNISFKANTPSGKSTADVWRWRA